MCGRYYRSSDKQRLAEVFRLGEMPDGFVLPPWNYNVAPTTFQPVIRPHRDTGARELTLMRWGLVPHFARSLADFKGFSTINAQAETLLQKAMWRLPFQRRRILVPADGFYEWKTGLPLDTRPAIDTDEQIDLALGRDIDVAASGLRHLARGQHPDAAAAPGAPSRPARTELAERPARRAAAVKTPYAFSLRSGEPFAFAGLSDSWKDPAGHWLHSFAIVTTEPNELTAQVHTRMPVVLHPRDYDRWLTRDPGSALGHGEPPVDLLRPYDADAMTMHRAHPDVGNVRNNHPELLNSA